MFLGTADEDTFHLTEKFPKPKKMVRNEKMGRKKRTKKECFVKLQKKKYFKKDVKKFQKTM